MENQEFLPAPDNHLVKAIFSVCFGFLPFGIVSVIYATKVKKLWEQGLRTQAYLKAQSANIWANISFISGIVVALCRLYAVMYATM